METQLVCYSQLVQMADLQNIFFTIEYKFLIYFPYIYGMVYTKMSAIDVCHELYTRGVHLSHLASPRCLNARLSCTTTLDYSITIAQLPYHAQLNWGKCKHVGDHFHSLSAHNHIKPSCMVTSLYVAYSSQHLFTDRVIQIYLIKLTPKVKYLN